MIRKKITTSDNFLVGSSFYYLSSVQTQLLSLVQGCIDSTRYQQDCSLFSPFSCVLCAICQIAFILFLPRIVSVKWDSSGFILFDYKHIVTGGQILSSLLLQKTLQRKIRGVRVHIECLSEGKPDSEACRFIHLSAYNE